MLSRERDFKRFYELLEHISRFHGGTRLLRDCTGRNLWPERGVYFFFEDGERRSGSGMGARVVRVGTHAITKRREKTKLWERLRAHRGTVKGSGYQRGSRFRKLIGASLIKRENLSCPSWDEQKNVPKTALVTEYPIEQRVSSKIGAMPFLWLAVDDPPGPESNRAVIERGAIALLSEADKQPIDPASEGWLGRYCNRPKVQASGLWNNNHVGDTYDPGFMDVMEHYVERQNRAT